MLGQIGMLFGENQVTHFLVILRGALLGTRKAVGIADAPFGSDIYLRGK